MKKIWYFRTEYPLTSRKKLSIEELCKKSSQQFEETKYENQQTSLPIALLAFSVDQGSNGAQNHSVYTIKLSAN